VEHGKQEIKQRTEQKDSVNGLQPIHAINKLSPLDGGVISF
jgi:hypothetical protein